MLKLTQEGCRLRREQLIAAAGADLLVINNPRHIFYLTGMSTSYFLPDGDVQHPTAAERLGAADAPDRCTDWEEHAHRP